MKSNHSEEKIIRVLIYGASSKLTPLLCYFILKENRSDFWSIRFHFLEITPEKEEIARRHAAIVEKNGSKALVDVLMTNKPKLAFRNVDYAIILPTNSFNLETESSISNDAEGYFFIYIGRALESYAKKSVKIIIFEERSVNIFCLVCSYFCPSIHPSQITGVSCHYELRAKRVLAKKIDSSPSRIKHVYVWGTDHVDIKAARLDNKSDLTTVLDQSSSAVRIIDFNSNQNISQQFSSYRHETQLYQHYSSTDSPNSTTNNSQPMNVFKTNDTNDRDKSSWKQACDFEPGFHCTDMILIPNRFDCYSYNLWDVKCPALTYRSRYHAAQTMNHVTKEKGIQKEGRNDEKIFSTYCTSFGEEELKELSDLIQDDTWLKSELVDRTKDFNRTKNIATISVAICHHFQHLIYNLTEPLSMIVHSDGSYNVHNSVYFSFPTKVVDGKIEIVKDICIDSMTQRYINTKSSSLMMFAAKLTSHLPTVPTVSGDDELKKSITSLIEHAETKEEDASVESSKYSYVSGRTF